MPERKRRLGVEIARVGRYELSTGSHEFSRAQLAAAVAHSATSAPRIGIGHIDPRFNAAGNDGDPAFGRVVNLRLDQDGDVLVGDFDGMASWLDENLEVAYPGRSLEARVKGDDMQITAVKLLGTTPPGISDLKDLATAIAASVADGETSEADAHIAIRTLWASPEQPAVIQPGPPVNPTPKEPHMDLKILRTSLGLAEDASDEDVTAKLAELNARPTAEAVTEQVAAAAQTAKAEAIAASAAAAPTAEHLAALQADAAAGREARELLASQDRETFIAAALGDGKIPPAAKDSYLQQLAAGGAVEKSTREFIDSLPKNTIPVAQIGASHADDAPELTTTGLFPQFTEV